MISIGRSRVSNQKKLLAILLLLLGLSIIYRIMNPFHQARVKKLTFGGNETSAKQHRAIQDEVVSMDPRERLLLHLFHNPPMNPDQTTRDIFQEGDALVGATETQPPTAEKEIISAAVPGPQPQVTAQDDLSGYQVFGLLEKKTETIVFIEKGKDILMVSPGDMIEGKYTVEKITDQAVALRSISTGTIQKLDLSDFSEPGVNGR